MFNPGNYELERIYYRERLNDAAALRRTFLLRKAELRARTSLTDRMGDWFISIGMKLKAQQGAPRMGMPLAQR